MLHKLHLFVAEVSQFIGQLQGRAFECRWVADEFCIFL